MPFIPLGDNIKRAVIPQPWVNWSLIAVCVLVFIIETQLPPQAVERLILGLGMIPANVTGQAPLPPQLHLVPALFTLITYAFLHGGVMHLAGNMVYLWVFGDNIEDSMGHKRYLLFFALCAALAALTHLLIDPSSRTPTIGASGAVSGVLGAYLVLFPRARVVIPIIFFPVYLPAWLLLILWFGFQVFSAFGEGGGVAWWAHIGGFVAGALLIVPFRRKTVALFAGTPHPSGVTFRRGTTRQTPRRGPWGRRKP